VTTPGGAPQFGPKSISLFWKSGQIVGYATCGPARGKKAKHGEIYELYVAPLYQGMGLGEHLFEACRHQLDIDQLEGMIVWALEDNISAQDFYWRRGGRPKGKSRESFSGKTLAKVAYGWA
jgi:ribosomal protein S18 acetylase RimI-like enzyme